MRRLLAVLWKDVVLRLTDPAVLLLAIAMPLAITALVELASGDLVLGRGLPGARIPVAVVNQDVGGRWGNFGDVLSYALRTTVNDRYRFRGEAFESVVETLASTVSIWEATVRAAVKGLMDDADVRAQLRSGELNEALAELARTAGLPASNPIKIRALPSVCRSTEIELTHYLAAAIAIFFSGYTALLRSASLLRERAQWTLQRMIITPTRPAVILGGKALATYLKGLIQMGALVGGLAGLELALDSGPSHVPRIDPAGLSLLILAAVAAARQLGRRGGAAGVRPQPPVLYECRAGLLAAVRLPGLLPPRARGGGDRVLAGPAAARHTRQVYAAARRLVHCHDDGVSPGSEAPDGAGVWRGGLESPAVAAAVGRRVAGR